MNILEFSIEKKGSIYGNYLGYITWECDSVDGDRIKGDTVIPCTSSEYDDYKEHQYYEWEESEQIMDELKKNLTVRVKNILREDTEYNSILEI